MIEHRIYARHCDVNAEDRLSIPLIKRCVKATLHIEGADVPCEVSVLISNDAQIRGINKEFRNIDKPTDVLSFPMQEFDSPGWAAHNVNETDPETGLLPLGEIIISAERIAAQACENNQTRDRETAYITIHSALHLLGYDHTDEAEGKRLMRSREKQIMQYIRGTGGV